MPFAPHLSCECLSVLEGKNFYEKIEWPKGNKSLLKDQEVTLVVQINGKRRGEVLLKKDSSEEDIYNELKNVSNINNAITGKNILITRELRISSPIENEFLNNSIASIDYTVNWGSKNEHWLSIDIVPEAHSWCEQII